MTIKIKIDDSKFGRKVKQLEGVPDRVANEAYKYFKKTTPIRTGNARRKTRLRSSTIQANYPYAQKLDNGFSRQAPKGMSQPTLEYIQKNFSSMLRRFTRG